MNVLGMVGTVVTPLFIGMVIDAIIAEDRDKVKTITILWMIFNLTGALF